MLHLGARWGWVINATRRPGRFTPLEWGPVPTVGTGWGPGAGLEVLEKKNNFVSVGIRTPPTVQHVASRWQTILSPRYTQFPTRKQSNFLQSKYRGADKSLARPTSRCILFDGWNISFDASLVIYTGCFTTWGHYCERWFPRSLWSKKFI